MRRKNIMSLSRSEKYEWYERWKAQIPKDITVEQAVDHCRNKAPDRENYWLVVWGLEDVRSEAEKSDLKLTDEQARQVLQYFSHHYDYVWEVSWELMSLSIKEVLGIERET
jgi:hypothetical protein